MMFGLNTRKIGNAAEESAAAFLRQKGYKIIAKNFTIRGGEIDLITRDGDDLVFVEVKMRSNTVYGSAADSITPWKIAALLKTARFYIQKINWGDKSYRFDLVTIDKENSTYKFNIIRNIIEL